MPKTIFMKQYERIMLGVNEKHLGLTLILTINLIAHGEICSLLTQELIFINKSIKTKCRYDLLRWAI